jgi:hypothetical protein
MAGSGLCIIDWVEGTFMVCGLCSFSFYHIGSVVFKWRSSEHFSDTGYE